ncbi:MAG TPA: hypothetical protein VMW53_07310 [archaeon]|nr:hypothetical protein [archaeon]
MKIYSHGTIRELDLSEKNIIENLSNEELGKFIRKYKIEKARSGSIWSAKLKGAMYEFEKGFFVVWSCGEYIDYAIFRKTT